MLAVRYEGLRELAQALRIVNLELYDALLAGLGRAGEVVRADAAQRFSAYGAGKAGFDQAAQGFRVLVRPNTSTMALVSVSQTIRRSRDIKHRRPNFGGLMMTKALLPARNEKMTDIVTAVDGAVSGLLHDHGF